MLYILEMAGPLGPSVSYGCCLSGVEQNGRSYVYILASYLLVHFEREDEVNHSLVLAFPSGKGPLMICGGVIPDSRQTSSCCWF